jgi:hypothetical protein
MRGQFITRGPGAIAQAWTESDRLALMVAIITKI